MWGLSLWFRDTVFPELGWLPIGGLAMGFSVSNLIEISLLLWLLRRKLGGLDGHVLLSGLLRMGAAVIVMVLAIGALLVWLPPTAVWARAILGSAIGGLFYLLACWLLRVEEWRKIIELFNRRAHRGKK
jgi:putative peptidoglycan lipid II flippase